MSTHLTKILNTLPKSLHNNLSEFFSTAPDSLCRACKYITFPTGYVFVHTFDLCHSVFILIEGRVKAVDQQHSDNIYVFDEFSALEFFGEMELFSSRSHYIADLMTTSPCRFIVIPSDEYQQWMQTDTKALYLRTCAMLTQLTHQASNERTHLFLNSTERIAFYFYRRYHTHEHDGILQLFITRQMLADQTGLSLRTVNRAVKKLVTDGLISIKRSQIIIDPSHYLLLKNLFTPKDIPL